MEQALSYATRTYWDRFYRDLFQSDDDLDWGDQRTAPFIEPLRRYNVRDILDHGAVMSNVAAHMVPDDYPGHIRGGKTSSAP